MDSRYIHAEFYKLALGDIHVCMGDMHTHMNSLRDCECVLRTSLEGCRRGAEPEFNSGYGTHIHIYINISRDCECVLGTSLEGCRRGAEPEFSSGCGEGAEECVLTA